jgi:hypothetical protein
MLRLWASPASALPLVRGLKGLPAARATHKREIRGESKSVSCAKAERVEQLACRQGDTHKRDTWHTGSELRQHVKGDPGLPLVHGLNGLPAGRTPKRAR